MRNFPIQADLASPLASSLILESPIISPVDRLPPAAPSEPAEFISNGGFAEGATDWSIPSGWSLSGASVEEDGGGATFLSQNFGAITQPLTPGNNYVFSCDMVHTAGDAFRFSIFDGTNTQLLGTDPGPGTVTIPFTATYASYELRIVNSDATFSGVTQFDNFSIVPA